ncbi:carbonic anhydrase 2 [Fopius arisanus]|uniref:Carbonic anhydrase n=1 Tax=Fopius arisanus TaxID=64838 RepID=A0A9R1T9G9_9HYME|nr:PREDICTED: carbonic anhydrase 2-like [Fopius arisanus]
MNSVMCGLLNISLILLICGIPVSQGFSYDKTGEWGNESPICNGKSQSPINIDFNDKNALKQDMVSLQWNGYENIPDVMIGANNGHTIKVIPKWLDTAKRPYLSGGPLDSQYVLQEFHFHWGADNSVGSEHTVNGKSFVLELHMVHWKLDYGSFSAAVAAPDGLAVVGSFYDVNNTVSKPSSGVNNIINIALILMKKGEEVDITPFPLSNFDAVNTPEVIATYKGSLTTPGCNEAVTWMVVIHGHPISNNHMETLRNVQLDNGENHNYRPVQPLNGRKVSFFH